MEHWRARIGGHYLEGAYYPAENHLATVSFLLGFKSTSDYYTHILEKLNAAGFSVLACHYPDPGNSRNYMDKYEALTREFLGADAADLPGRSKGPQVLFAHSMGAYFVTRLLLEQESAAAILKRYSGAVFSYPFYTAPFARKPSMREGFRLASLFLSNTAQPLPDTVSDLHGLREETHFTGTYGYPTHRQILYMTDHGRAFLAGFESRIREKEDSPRIPLAFFMGRRDFVADPLAGYRVASALGGETHFSDTEHNTLLESEKMTARIIGILREMAAKPPGSAADYQFLPGHEWAAKGSRTKPDLFGIASANHIRVVTTWARALRAERKRGPRGRPDRASSNGPVSKPG